MEKDRLDKLRELILHDGTPVHERRAALGRFEDMIGRKAVQRLRTPITRSARIGKQRRGIYINELDRLEYYARGETIGDVLAALSKALVAVKSQPTAFDFGWDKSRGPVVGVGFVEDEAPRLVDFQDAVREHYAEAVVTRADLAADNESKLLVFLGQDETE
jgi:hypothetical protein